MVDKLTQHQIDLLIAYQKYKTFLDNNKEIYEKFKVVGSEIKLRNAAAKSLREFIRYTKPDYVFNWHHELIISEVQSVLDGDCKNLMIMLPPQVGKTEIVTRRAIPFALGYLPTCKLGLITYSQTFSDSLSRQVRSVINSNLYYNVFGEISDSDNKSARYKNATSFVKGRNQQKTSNLKLYESPVGTGSVMFSSVDGALTGNKIDILIIDDPVKNLTDISSEVTRQKIIDWYDSSSKTRLHNDSRQIICMTRWHENDLIGYLLRTEPEKWRVIRIPALSSDLKVPDDIDPRGPCEAIWESVHSSDRYIDIAKKTPQVFVSMYQQRPSREDGNILNPADVQLLSYYNFVNEHNFSESTDSTHIVIDTSYGDKKYSDFSGFLTFLSKNNNLYIIDFQLDVLDMDSLYKRTLEIAASNLTNPNTGIVFIEPKASGVSLRQDLQKFTGLNVVDYKLTRGSKVDKAKLIKPYLAAKRVYVVGDKLPDWWSSFSQQLKIFPNGDNDEAVDCLIMAVNICLRQKSSKNDNIVAQRRMSIDGNDVTGSSIAKLQGINNKVAGVRQRHRISI